MCGKRACRLSRGGGGSGCYGGDFAFLLEKEEPLAREVLRQAAPGAGPKNGGALYPGGLSLRPGECAGHLGRGHPGRRTGAVPHPSKLLPALGGLAVVEVKYDAFLPEIVKLAVQVPTGRGRPAPSTPCAAAMIEEVAP